MFITKITGLDKLPEPKDPLPIRDVRLTPKISAVSVSGKKLMVQGDDFSMGAAIILDGVEQQTSNDAESPNTRLMSKKAGKKVKIAQEAMIQVRNSDDALSETFRFVRQQ